MSECCFNFHRQKVADAEEETASVTLSAQEKQRELVLLLEQTEAGNQQRGQSFRPPHCPFVPGIISIVVGEGQITALFYPS